MRWGLVPWWWSKPLKELRMATFNARAETVETKPVFRDAFKPSRCLIPMSGYYEWQNTPGGKQPWYFTARDGSPILTAAGLWDEWKNRETGERIKSCTMIVGEPNEFAVDIHDRMPVFLSGDQFAPWLSGEAGAEVLKPAPKDFLQRWPVSKRVNSSKADADDATLIDPVELEAGCQRGPLPAA
jgi:putative SOS response-associated peptidase YedK